MHANDNILRVNWKLIKLLEFVWIVFLSQTITVIWYLLNFFAFLLNVVNLLLLLHIYSHLLLSARHLKFLLNYEKDIGLTPYLFRFQPVLVFMSKVDGKFKFSPVSVNFLTEATKVVFAILMLLIQVHFIYVFGFTQNIFFIYFLLESSIYVSCWIVSVGQASKSWRKATSFNIHICTGKMLLM